MKVHRMIKQARVAVLRGWGGQVGQTQPNMSIVLYFGQRLTTKFTTSVTEVRITKQKRPKSWRKKTQSTSLNAQF